MEVTEDCLVHVNVVVLNDDRVRILYCNFACYIGSMLVLHAREKAQCGVLRLTTLFCKIFY